MQDNLVFWYKDTYRGVFLASRNAVIPFVPMTIARGPDGILTKMLDYPQKELMLQEQPHLATYTQIDLEVDIPWQQFFGVK